MFVFALGEARASLGNIVSTRSGGGVKLEAAEEQRCEQRRLLRLPEEQTKKQTNECAAAGHYTYCTRRVRCSPPSPGAQESCTDGGSEHRI